MDPQTLQAIVKVVQDAVINNLRTIDLRQVGVPQNVPQAAPNAPSPANSNLPPPHSYSASEFSDGYSTPSSSAGLSRSASGFSTSSSAGLARSSSGFSTSSARSASEISINSASTVIGKKRKARSLDENERKKRKGRRSNPEQNAIIDAITRPIMDKMDRKFLAPPESPLFQHEYKKSTNPDGTRSLRKHKTMVMPLFKALVRPILRGILGRLDVPNVPEMYAKYYRAAIKIVTKRRANHVQNWRLHGVAGKLVYGDSDNEGESQPPDEGESQPPDEGESQPQVEDESQPPAEGESQPQAEGESQPQAEDESQPPAKDNFQCVDCKKYFSRKKSYFPPDQSIWAPDANTRLRCRKCYKKYIEDKVAPLVIEGAETRKLEKALMPPGKKKKTKKKTKAKTVKCKWCGSNSHKTKRSKKCPFFGSKVPAPPPAKKTDAPTPPAETTDDAPTVQVADTPKCKWCGSNSHKTKRSKKCPFFGSKVPTPPPAETTDDAPTPPAEKTDAPTVQVADTPIQYNIGDTVLAMWSRRKWFLAHVTAIKDRKYDLYFPDDAKVKLGVDPKRVKACPVSRGLPVRKRGDMINKVFYDDGIGKKDRIDHGMWLVRLVKDNEYLCVRSPDCRNKNSTPNSMYFDVGYVMRTIENEEQQTRNEF